MWCSLYSSSKPTETSSNIRKQHSAVNKSVRACNSVRLHNDHFHLCPCQTYQLERLFAKNSSKYSLVNVVGSLQLSDMETSKDVLRVKSFVRGYHEYKEIWEPKIGQEAMLMREPKIDGTLMQSQW